MEQPIERLTADLPESVVAQGRYAEPTSDIEQSLAEVLASVVRVERISLDSHFFDDLGANSLVMAQFCARVRKRGDLPPVSMKDVYQHPTIRLLASSRDEARPDLAASSVPVSAEVGTPSSTRQYVLCGMLQLLIFLGYSFLVGLVITWGYDWISASSGGIDLYLRSALFGGAFFLGLCGLPIVAKWLLIGRWKAGAFPVWGLSYLRFWIIKMLLYANPMAFFVGTPLYVWYLRALGAHIGSGVTILSRSIPVCTDLLTIGAGTLIRKDTHFQCYQAHAGRIQTGPITLGRNVYIGEKTVLDIYTTMGDRAQLGHTSALHSGKAIPAGQHWHGSPAHRTALDYVRVPPAHCGRLRPVSFGLALLLVTFLVIMPLAVGGVYLLFTLVPALAKLLGPGTAELLSLQFYLNALGFSLILFLGAVLVGFVVMCTVPRLLNLALKPDTVYPLYGFHYALHRAIMAITNSTFFNWLFGDSSYVVNYLLCLGYDLSLREQTGANFGDDTKHETPYLSSFGRGTMVCDGLSIVNADFSSTSFRLSRASIGAHNFLGNDVVFPSGARTGDNVLLATKVMVPLDGEVREDVGLLGSPSFEIPRSVERNSRFDYLRNGDEFRRQLAAKNRYNLRTIGLFLFLRWLHVFALTLLTLAAITLYDAFGALALAVALALNLLVSIAYFVLVERAIAAFRPLQPQYCSIYEPYYWWHERYWKMIPETYLNIFNGTPFKNVIWRLLGVRLGHRVFDDGCTVTERTLTIIGDDCTLNDGSKIYCHSMEDGIFKSDYTALGAGCTLGVGAFVHYGVMMGDGAMLAADSFLMKGEEIPPRSLWGGNPARVLANSHTVSIPQMVAHQVSSPEDTHFDGHAHHLIEDNIDTVQVCQDNNNHYDTCCTVRQQGVARRSLKEGKIRREN